MKKLGVRWMPGLPFLDGERVSHAFSRPEETTMEGGLLIHDIPGLALVLVLAQDPNITIEQQQQQQKGVWEERAKGGGN